MKLIVCDVDHQNDVVYALVSDAKAEKLASSPLSVSATELISDVGESVKIKYIHGDKLLFGDVTQTILYPNT
jgi:hypothetical protein